MSRIQLFYDVAENMRHLADSIQALADEMVGNSQEQEPEPAAVAEPESGITLEDVRAVLVQLSHDGYSTQVQALIRNHGATKLSELPSSEYASLLEEAEVMANGS